MGFDRPVGVVGAGTMGAGIAQLAAQAGAPTLLHDPVDAALGRGMDGLGRTMDRLVERGKLPRAEADAVLGRITPAHDLDALAGCAVVVEAAPERLDLKLDLFGRLAEVTTADAVLATNTSSLSVTELAAGTPHPERVVGLHFFNPAPVMRLAEVVAAEQSSAAAVATARALGEAMGKRVIAARDVPGFLVNRVNRPFSLEALKLVQERVAAPEQVDRICRLGAGFRMGPFELMDLIGIETNHAVAEGFFRQTFGEPRFQPSPLAARKIAAGHLGRKTGEGWYVYDADEDRPADPEPPAPGGGAGRVVQVTGDGPVADALRADAAAAGFASGPANGAPWLAVGCGPARPTAAHRAVLLDSTSLHAADVEAAGFHLLAPAADARLVELTSTPRTPPQTTQRARAFFAATGRVVEEVGDAPGLVLGRIVAQLINEAAFLIGEGNGSPEDVDAGLQLGVNHPRGPVAWSREIGLGAVAATLAALHRESGEERYRTAPLIRRRAALGLELA